MGKLPENANRVFKGEIFEVWQWEQKLYDGSKAIFEAIKRPDTIQIIPILDGKILLSNEEQPHRGESVGFLGGRKEEDEEVLECAKRELLEETGLESDDWELIKTYHKEGKMAWQMFLYVARNSKKVGEQKLDPGEKIEVKEYDFNKFMDEVCGEEFLNRTISDDFFRMKYDEKRLREFKIKLLG